MILQNALKMIIQLQGVDVTIKDLNTGNTHSIKAAISNYFRSAVVEEEIVSKGRQYVISNHDLSYIPKRGDGFIVNANQYFTVSDSQELIAFGKVIGYRLVLK